MKVSKRLLPILFGAWFLSHNPVLAQTNCADLSDIGLPKTTITAATLIQSPPDYFPPRTTGPFGTRPGLKVSVPFCRVVGYIEPVAGSHIGFEVWMPPAESWNGRFLATGNPAFEGAISYGGMARIVEQGYATASTDTGHVASGHSWAVGYPERLTDWGHRAVHETTMAAKRLIREFYGKPQDFAYWSSCHNGGNQGLNEVQRYPEDYDGVIAGDPAYYITRLQSGSEYIAWVALKDGIEAPGYIPPAKYPVLHRAVLDTCDADDGLRDGILTDPTRCRFDPEMIQCQAGDNAACLTPAQVETARLIYRGARFTDGTLIYTGFEPGSELRWGEMAAGPDPLEINNGYFRHILMEDPEWDFRNFDVDLHTRLAGQRLGSRLDAADPDLNRFRAHGGKLLIYQSWEETWVPPRMIINYYNEVTEKTGGRESASEFLRLFMVPGMGMCPGFNNAEDFNALEAMQRWVEQGIAPESITARYTDQGRVLRTRPVCSYPRVAAFKGTGDPDVAENFTCE